MALADYTLFQFHWTQRLFFRLVPVPLFLVVLSGAGCTPSLNWREVRIPQAQGLVMMFPCKPETQQRQVQLPGLGDAPVQMHVLACEADGVTWAISHFDAQTPERWLRAPALWQSAMQANLTAMPGQAQAPRLDVAVFHAPGGTPHPDASTWWAQGQRPVSLKDAAPVAVKVWHFAKGMQLFQASVWAPALQADDPRWVTFAKGIHFQP